MATSLVYALEAEGILESPSGQIAVGWLIVEDLVTVLILVLLPALATSLGGQTDPADHPAQDNDAIQIYVALGFVVCAGRIFRRRCGGRIRSQPSGG
jgi:monovalent cation:H+ antiporter-2, CPA2 family